MITADINLTVQTLHFRKQNNGFFRWDKLVEDTPVTDKCCDALSECALNCCLTRHGFISYFPLTHSASCSYLVIGLVKAVGGRTGQFV